MRMAQVDAHGRAAAIEEILQRSGGFGNIVLTGLRADASQSHRSSLGPAVSPSSHGVPVAGKVSSSKAASDAHVGSVAIE